MPRAIPAAWARAILAIRWPTTGRHHPFGKAAHVSGGVAVVARSGKRGDRCSHPHTNLIVSSDPALILPESIYTSGGPVERPVLGLAESRLARTASGGRVFRVQQGPGVLRLHHSRLA